MHPQPILKYFILVVVLFQQCLQRDSSNEKHFQPLLKLTGSIQFPTTQYRKELFQCYLNRYVKLRQCIGTCGCSKIDMHQLFRFTVCVFRSKTKLTVQNFIFHAIFIKYFTKIKQMKILFNHYNSRIHPEQNLHFISIKVGL